MYQLTIGNKATLLATLGDVLVALNDRRYGDPVPALDTITLTREEQPLEVVARSSKFGVQQQGTGQAIFEAMLNEVDQFYVRPDGKVRMPFQMTRSQWAAVQAVSSAAADHYPCFTPEQRLERNVVDRGGFPCEVDLYGLRNNLFTQRFGYGAKGPAYDEQGQTNEAHDIHVGYALAAGKPVPENVIEEYLERDKEPSKYTKRRSNWYPLLRFPVLRGAILPGNLKHLCSILHEAKVELTDENIGQISDVMQRLPEGELTWSQLDDHLYQHGVVHLPEFIAPAAVGEAEAYSDLARHLSEAIRIYRQKNREKILKAERAKGMITQRQFESGMAQAGIGNEHGRMTLANDTAQAVAEKNLPYLLSKLDVPDEHSLATKRTLEIHLGLKLIRLKAAERRAAVFRFCGYGPEEQAEFENLLKAKKKKVPEAAVAA